MCCASLLETVMKNAIGRMAQAFDLAEITNTVGTWYKSR